MKDIDKSINPAWALYINKRLNIIVLGTTTFIENDIVIFVCEKEKRSHFKFLSYIGIFVRIDALVRFLWVSFGFDKRNNLNMQYPLVIWSLIIMVILSILLIYYTMPRFNGIAKLRKKALRYKNDFNCIETESNDIIINSDNKTSSEFLSKFIKNYSVDQRTSISKYFLMDLSRSVIWTYISVCSINVFPSSPIETSKLIEMLIPLGLLSILAPTIGWISGYLIEHKNKQKINQILQYFVSNDNHLQNTV